MRKIKGLTYAQNHYLSKLEIQGISEEEKSARIELYRKMNRNTKQLRIIEATIAVFCIATCLKIFLF